MTQSLTSNSSRFLAGEDRGAIAPGLLRVLQQAAGLRLILAALGVATFMLARNAGFAAASDAAWLPWLFGAQAAVYFAFVAWPGSRRALGRSFLPLALGWFLVEPVVEQALILRLMPSLYASRVGAGIGGAGLEGLLLVVPVILATWQWGRRGLLASLALLLAGQLCLAPLVGGSAPDVAVYLLNSVGRVAMAALLGFVTLELMTALRDEHLQLTEANRQLAQRAATAEQLAESRERNRLARELHDTLAHSLTGLSVQLKALETLLAYDPAAANAQLKEAQATVRTGLQEARRAIQALRAAPLEDLGLSQALRQLCDRTAERTGLTIDCRIAEVGPLDELAEQAIYRVAEASLANVEEHAGAEKVEVMLEMTADKRVRLEVRDDGVGFDPAAVPSDRFGIAGMRERAQLIGASLRVESRPGAGTLVSVVVGR
jgi:signal transduction histidine kinase